MFAVEMSNSPETGILLDRLALLGRGCVPGLIISVLLTVVGLAISSLVERTNTATIAIFGVLVIAAGMAPITARFILEDPAWHALNPFNAVQTIANDILPPMPGALPNFEDVSRNAKAIPLTAAWVSIACWTGAGLAVLIMRIRKVEVVT